MVRWLIHNPNKFSVFAKASRPRKKLVRCRWSHLVTHFEVVPQPGSTLRFQEVYRQPVPHDFQIKTI